MIRYEGGQYYRPHHDFFADEFNKKRGGQRVCTVLMYLTTPEEGGETVFPQAGGFGSKCQCGGKVRIQLSLTINDNNIWGTGWIFLTFKDFQPHILNLL
jgi:prolyl 4-hydroxylase